MKKNEYRNEFEVAFCRSKFLMIILGSTDHGKVLYTMTIEIMGIWACTFCRNVKNNYNKTLLKFLIQKT